MTKRNKIQQTLLTECFGGKPKRVPRKLKKAIAKERQRLPTLSHINCLRRQIINSVNSVTIGKTSYPITQFEWDMGKSEEPARILVCPSERPTITMTMIPNEEGLTKLDKLLNDTSRRAWKIIPKRVFQSYASRYVVNVLNGYRYFKVGNVDCFEECLPIGGI